MPRPLWYIETPGGGVQPSATPPPDTADRHVADERVEPYRVSTVFLALDHSHEPGGPPVLYETMLFGDGAHDNWCRRYHTRAEATEGHAAVVAALRETGRPPGEAE